MSSCVRACSGCGRWVWHGNGGWRGGCTHCRPVYLPCEGLCLWVPLLAAMPAGINVYVFATYYNRGVNVATNVVLISTILSVVTLTGWLYFLGI